MQISDNKTIQEIQQEFSEKFENLKLEFYSSAHAATEGSPPDQQIDPSKTIGEIRTIHKEGDVSINGHLKVRTLEEQFAENYGLNVQVFRRSGDIWLQTTSTDDWTLSDQNRRGHK